MIKQVLQKAIFFFFRCSRTELFSVRLVWKQRKGKHRCAALLSWLSVLYAWHCRYTFFFSYHSLCQSNCGRRIIVLFSKRGNTHTCPLVLLDEKKRLQRRVPADSIGAPVAWLGFRCIWGFFFPGSLSISFFFFFFLFFFCVVVVRGIGALCGFHFVLQFSLSFLIVLFWLIVVLFFFWRSAASLYLSSFSFQVGRCRLFFFFASCFCIVVALGRGKGDLTVLKYGFHQRTQPKKKRGVLATEWLSGLRETKSVWQSAA